jgi:DNA polymerase III epsilon subunit-like protein
MIVVDIEGSGVDPNKNSILSIGAVEFEHPENQFYGECRAWDGAHIEPAALAVNGFSLEQATDKEKKTDKELLLDFIKWAESCKEKTFAGQNPSYDRDFMEATAHRYHINWPFAHRTLDTHSVAYFHAIQKGVEIPMKKGHSDLSLDKILLYCGLSPEDKPHNGLNGAKLEAEVLSRLFYEKPLFPEHKARPIPWLH